MPVRRPDGSVAVPSTTTAPTPAAATPGAAPAAAAATGTAPVRVPGNDGFTPGAVPASAPVVTLTPEASAVAAVRKMRELIESGKLESYYEAAIDVGDPALKAEAMKLFEALPCSFVFDKLFFVHAGIPRDDTFAEKWQGLESLNEFDLRFQMLWSDPSQADSIPVDLQKQSARFPFGRRQFRAFMQKIGCTTMIRGHERIIDGFKEVYADPEARLLNLFSAGGEHNNDLPEDSNYREVKPKALTINYRGGVAEIVPWEIDYAKYNSAETNAFFREAMDAAKNPRSVR